MLDSISIMRKMLALDDHCRQRMNSSPLFTVLEHKLPSQIGLPPEELLRRRNDHLVKGEDWQRIGRWIKWTEGAVQKVLAQIRVEQEQLKPLPPDAQWQDAIVTRCNFPNPRIIEVQEAPGKFRLVRIKPEWRDSYKQKMPIKILVNGEPVATTRRPRGRYSF
jgi:hypothetical protein